MSSGLRSFLAIVLSMGVLILWYTVIAPPQPPAPQPQAHKTASQPETAVAKQPAESTAVVPIVPRSGETIFLENNLVRVAIHPQGGVVTEWSLKHFTRNGQKETGQELVGLAETNGSILETPYPAGDRPAGDRFLFGIREKSASAVQLEGRVKGVLISKRFSLKNNSYQLEMELEVHNRGDQTIAFDPSVVWNKQAIEESPQRGVLFFKTPPDQWQPVHFSGGKLEMIPWQKIPAAQTQPGDFSWIGAESRYFLGAVVPRGKRGARIDIGQYQTEAGEKFFYQKLFLPTVQILPKEEWSQTFLVYGGPKDYQDLKSIATGFEQTLGLGWTSIVAVPILYLLKFFYNVVRNYGLAIILLTVLIKILLNPINRKSLQSMKGMQALQPRLKELREKYGQDKEKLNLEMMQLFKAHKINPMGGCLPMALQIPIYIALYKVLWSSVELYHAPFFWFYKDLSAPDPYLITPIFLGITMFVQTKMTPTPSADPAQQKMMLIMPFMFCAFMIFLPMGLGLYILVNTLMTILQQKMYQKDIRMRDVVLGRVFRS